MFTLSQKKQTAAVVLQLICLLTIVYCSYYLCSCILWSVFLSLWSVIFRATNANQQPALFSHQQLEERNITFSQM